MPKLLLADDSVTIQRVIELTFADEQIQVIAVGDGQQAIQKIEAEQPDVVLADVGMPERDGYEVAAHVKGSPHLAHIPVILLTGAFEPIDEARARSVGCDGVLVKPFEPQMVINRVKDLLAGRRPASLWATAPGGGPAPVTAAARAPQKRETAAASPEAAAAEPDRSQPIESLDEYFDRLDAAFSHAEATSEPPKPASASGAIEPPALSRAEGPALSRAEGPAQSRADAPAASRAEAPPAGAPDFGDWDIAIDRSRPAATDQGAAARPAIPMPRPAPTASRAEAATPTRTEPGVATAPPPAPPAAAAPGVTAPTRAEAPAPSRAEAPAPSRVEAPALADAFAALLAAEQGQSVRPGSREAASESSASGGAATQPGTSVVNDAQVEEIVRRVLARMTDQVVRQTVVPIAERLVREEIDRVKKGTS
jgi:CheY-like chemotaxis protein